MKRRKFLTNSAVLGSAIPLGVATPAMFTSCSENTKKGSRKSYSQIAIMGREAAYTGQAITWDEIMASNLRYGPEIYEMGPLPDYHERMVPIPGKDPSNPM